MEITLHTARLSRLLPTLLLTVPCMASASDVVVAPTNKAGFQAALDSASDGDEIVCLGGVYDFSDLGAVLITKGLEIVADDSNNPPIFVGLLDANLKYTSDAFLQGMGLLPPGPTNLTGNTAFAVPPGAIVDGLEIEGLRLEGFDRGITTLVGFDFDTQGNCWLLPAPGSLTEMTLEDNHISNCGSGMQILGGPLEEFEIKDNVIDCSNGNNVALNVQGDHVPCGAIFANVLRPMKGEIKGNVIHGAPGETAMNVAGVERIEVKNNTVYGQPNVPGILLRDVKAFTFGPFANAIPAFGDDGPIRMGEIKDNTIYNAGFGIACLAATTLSEVQIEGNTMVGSQLFDILIANTVPGFNGSNGFMVKDNNFSGTAAVAEILLDSTTFNNEVKVPVGTRVIDLGDNTVNFE